MDGLVQVMPTPAVPVALKVRWPGGRTTSTPVSAELREVTVNPDGAIVSKR
jgi:hypothetical protein